MAETKPQNFSNKDIQRLFENVAAALTIKGENRFRVIAYQNAATGVEHATSEIKSLWQEGKLDDIPGFGAQIQEYLDELFKTGEVKHFQAAFKGIKPATFDFLVIPGVGPKTAQKLADAGAESISDLKDKLKSGTLDKEVTPKLKSNLLDALSSLDKNGDGPKRMLLPYAMALAEEYTAYMKKSKAVLAIEPLGSLRRRLATIGDVDFAVSSDDADAVIKHFTAYPQVENIIGAGDNKAAVMLKVGIHVDLLVEKPEHFGALLQHFTGSKQHNIHLRKLANAKGLTLSETGIKPLPDQKAKFDYKRLSSVTTEEKFYHALGMDWIPPEIREDTGEIEAALAHKVPELISLDDIKGDLHLHSNYPGEPSHDLGADSMQDLYRNAERLGYAYINLTDHNPGLSTHSEKQIIDIIEKRGKHIEQLRSTTKVKLLNSLEIDILLDGNLAVPETGLKLLDLPICGIHSRHNMVKDEIMKRLQKALENPYLKILVHPTNRLLNQRPESDIDWDILFDLVKKHNKVLEINAFPDRLDLTDGLVREAISRGIKLVISTDSHAVDHMANMRFGVDVARRGWATKGDIINTWPWEEFKKYFKLEVHGS